MRTVSILLLLVCLVACNNNGNQNNSNENTSELVTETTVSNDAPITKKKPVTLDFPSYHLYADDSEKYDASGFIPSSAIITIDEAAQKAELKLYDGSTNQWDTFSFRIEEKVKRAEDYVTFLVYNNANKKSYIDVKVSETEGIYVDVKYFVFEGSQIACWMKDNDETNITYTDYTETPNTYHSSPNTNSSPNNISNGSMHSDESISGNYYYYKETNECEEGVVVYEGRGGYYIVETKKGYIVLEDYSGTLYEGAMLRGELNQSTFKYIINRNRNQEIKVNIEDIMLSDVKALNWLGEHGKLKYDDQVVYDDNNN